ncbi:MAG TPA: LLM class flavin-dependent oxidoreductase [bacterium]|jgi:probable F420-dependent oxidoreductase|nr:LLM class flavin-dependent oxidoreductase [bacterium]
MSALGVALRDLLPPAGPRAALPVRAIVDLAVLAERLGYDSVWIPEGRGREALAQLGAIADATSRIRLGTGIMPVFSRPPTLAAMGLATLDDLSGGRVVFGIGAGDPGITQQGYGQPFRLPVVAVREFVEIVRLALSGETVRYSGKVFQVQEFALESVPSRRIPIYVAALRGRMLRVAGKIGDGVLLNWMTPERAAQSSAIVREAARAAGRAEGSVHVACFVRACVTEEVDSARAMLRRIIATYAALPAYARMFEESGFVEEVQAIRARWQSGIDAATQCVSDRMVDSLGVIGTTAQCRAGIDRFRDGGVDLPIVYPFATEATPESYRRTIVALAPGT